MTVYTQISQNNWPSSKNQYDDYLVSEMPFSQQSGLIARDIVAGTKVLSKNGLTTGNAQLATDQFKYYGSSLYCYGSGSGYRSLPANSGYAVKTGDFTIEAWYRVASSQTINARLFGQTLNDPSNFDCYIDGTSGTNAINMHGGNVSLGMSFPSANVWHHFAISRQGNTLRSFMNGVLQNTNTNYTLSIGNATDVFHIGHLANQGYVLNGYVQDFRFWRYARYTANFTPPGPILGSA